MLLFIVDEKGTPRWLSRGDLERLPQQEIYKSEALKGLTVGGVRLAALLDAVFGTHVGRALAAESADGERLALSAQEIAGAVLVYRLGVGPLSTQMGGPLRLMLVDGGQIVSVRRLRGIHLTSEAQISADDAA